MNIFDILHHQKVLNQRMRNKTMVKGRTNNELQSTQKGKD